MKPLIRTSILAAVALLLGVLHPAHAVAASPSVPVDLPVTPGWDVFPPLTSGSVTYQTPGSSDKLKLTFELRGAEPNQVYTVGIDVFNLPDPGVTMFTVPRYVRGTFLREGVLAIVDVFPIATFTTDADGNGSLTLKELSLEATPPGEYNVQFWWSRQGPFGVFYRTGIRHGEGFAIITR